MKYIYITRILLVVALGITVVGVVTQLEFLIMIGILLNVIATVLALISLIKREK